MKQQTYVNFLNKVIDDDLRLKFMSLPSNRKTELISELHKTFLLGIRALVVENLPASKVQEFETVVKEQDDDGILLFGFKSISGFANKLDLLKTKIQTAFLEELKN